MIEQSDKIALKEIISILQDKEWHDVYEFHEVYRLSPAMIVKSIQHLLKMKLIFIDKSKVIISREINNENISHFNYLMKNSKPAKLSITNLEYENEVDINNF